MTQNEFKALHRRLGNSHVLAIEELPEIAVTGKTPEDAIAALMKAAEKALANRDSRNFALRIDDREKALGLMSRPNAATMEKAFVLRRFLAEGAVAKKDGTFSDREIHGFVMEDEEADLRFRKLMVERASSMGMSPREAKEAFGIESDEAKSADERNHD
jgi:predicted RNase H-like HicB family nuclease